MQIFLEELSVLVMSHLAWSMFMGLDFVHLIISEYIIFPKVKLYCPGFLKNILFKQFQTDTQPYAWVFL